MTRFVPLFLLPVVAIAQTRHIKVIAHRGERLRHAENSPPAIEESIHLGANYVELDICITSDGKLVLKHEMLDRVVAYCNPAQAREILALNPQVRAMPEAGDDVIRVAREAGVKIFVDRLGPADNEAAWRDAIARGADGIQTDRPAELIQFLKSLEKP
ncbi:MAG TPA: glycerophosphodiester phosphodiesterase family protein [Bryobacteraceae bacterium]|nr:glycerophosphodiester phosphodiesterase family protein [Bryobacteraceae bacterium]